MCPEARRSLHGVASATGMRHLESMTTSQTTSARRLLLAILTLSALACFRGRGAPAADPMAEARAFFDSYVAALRAGQRDRIATFYSASGAYLANNGPAVLMSRAAIDNIYRGTGWQPPVHFAFDTLTFDRLDDDEVLVSGRFRWVTSRPDTMRVVYLAVLERAPSGYGIKVESETVLPRPSR